MPGFFGTANICKEKPDTVASAPDVTGSVFMQRFRLYLGQYGGFSVVGACDNCLRQFEFVLVPTNCRLSLCRNFILTPMMKHFS